MTCNFCKSHENIYSVLLNSNTIKMCVDCFAVHCVSHRVRIVLDDEKRVVIQLEKKSLSNI